jgi:hypothetical protein
VHRADIGFLLETGFCMDIETSRVKKCTGLILDLHMNGFYMDIEIRLIKST